MLLRAFFFTFLILYAYSCVCDTTNICDSKCCCDLTCNSTLISYWTQFGQCSPTYANGMQIPLCSSTNSIQIGDIHSGLRTMYTVIKQLFCVSKVNADLSSYNNAYMDITNSQISSIIKNINSSYSYSVTNDPRTSFKTSTVISGNTLVLPIQRSDGRCANNPVYIGIDQPYIECRSSISSNLLTISYFQNLFNGVSKSVNKYDKNGNILNSVSTNISGTLFNNVVRSGIFEFTTDGTNLTNVNAQLIIQNVTSNSGLNTIYQSFQYSWIYTNNTYTKSSNIGYLYGTPLIFANSSTILSSPLRIPFANFDGTCASSSTTYMNSYQIKFGVNSLISCIGSFGGNITSFVNKVAKIGGASINNIGDFVNISSNSITNSPKTSYLLAFTYSRIGKKQNNMFQITSATLTNADSPFTGSSSIYIQFLNVGNNVEVYIPPSPSAQIYLPNDVLYPFTVY